MSAKPIKQKDAAQASEKRQPGSSGPFGIGRKINSGLETLNYRLLLPLFMLMLLPTIYKTVRIHVLGTLPEAWGFNIASQVAWLNIAYEVLQEGLFLPLFYAFGALFGKREHLHQRIKTTFYVVFVAFGAFAVCLHVFIAPVMEFANIPQEIRPAVATYIRLETFAIVLLALYTPLMILLVIQDDQKAIWGLVVCQTILTVLGDIVFLSQEAYSLKLGVNGIAITNMAVYSALIVLSLVFLQRNQVPILHILVRKTGVEKIPLSWAVFRAKFKTPWFRQTVFSGLESLIRNLAFLYMILGLVNQVGESGKLWVANHFIWGWLLLPVLTLGTLIKRDVSLSRGVMGQRMKGYFVLTALFIAVWFLTLPAWEGFIHTVMGIQNANEIYKLALLSLGFYVLFAFNNVMDSYFYGIGKIELLLLQTLIVNIFYYGTFFVLYQVGIYNPTLYGIALMFGGSLFCDFFVTLFLYRRERKRSRA